MTGFRGSEPADVVIVGAGIVGLAHAVEAVARGCSVTVVERDAAAVGASVRNFGHGCFTAQAGDALRYATAARPRWTQLAKEAGFECREAGTLVLARHDDELAVLDEFAQQRGDEVELLTADRARELAPFAAGLVGGAHLPLDIRVDPRAAVGAIAARLADQGVTFLWRTSVTTIEPGVVNTSRGPVRGRRIVVAVGHNVDRIFPDAADAHGVRRCTLHMLRVRDPHARPIDTAVLTGHSLLRYDGFAQCDASAAVAKRLRRELPYASEAGLNLMFTQRPDGSLTIGDTHAYATTPLPFNDEQRDELVLTEIARLLGVPRLDVLERWRGTYASAPQPFLVATPMSDVRAVSVTSGIGMTTALGLALDVLDDLL